MAHTHRLHADDEGVREGGEHQQHRREAAGAERAPRELHGIRHARGGIEDTAESRSWA